MHFIVLIDVDKQSYAYHASSLKQSDIDAVEKSLFDKISQVENRKPVGLHDLTTDSPTFHSVQVMDQYLQI
ncbi:hypothetical protein [Companilactobacillus ginsenosidimutans]|uniref:Uncharacterized protein n=1 Tax=Companilactobacillus ginsenosidimutans TaxID=1007676 RepID=A0A0H4QGX6_9LACO|nr:hypothetical protein [Companilactobacillus ginsenosidimutans]AKP67664.1 hypothetical protein ABM34_09080 [Companilactobacillus ginsenosidimutans]